MTLSGNSLSSDNYVMLISTTYWNNESFPANPSLTAMVDNIQNLPFGQKGKLGPSCRDPDLLNDEPEAEVCRGCEASICIRKRVICFWQIHTRTTHAMQNVNAQGYLPFLTVSRLCWSAWVIIAVGNKGRLMWIPNKANYLKELPSTLCRALEFTAINSDRHRQVKE